MRPLLLIALFVLSPCASGEDVAGNKPAGQFIDKSVVTYPISLNHHTLVKEGFDPDRVADGVSLDYELGNAPKELQFNIYVYPRGRVDPAKAVADAMVEIEGEIRYIEQKKIYSDLQFQDDFEFDVAAPPAKVLARGHEQPVKLSEAPVTRASSDAGETRDGELADALDSISPPAKTIGRKRPLAMTVRGTREQSIAYVFYRNLFLISVRATAPVTALPADKFNALIDQAVQDLVPTMEIQNFGGCGSIYLSVDTKSADKDKAASDGAVQLVREMARIQRENCASKPGADLSPPQGRSQQTITYPADFWQ